MTLTKLQTIGIIIFSIIVFGAVGSSVYFYTKYKNSSQLLGTQSTAGSEETRKLKEKVGKLIDLPSDEDPSVATVNDVTKLKDQPFFAKAKNGDKVLVFTKAQKAILYDPIANKILEVGPIVIPTPTGGTTQSSNPVPVSEIPLQAAATIAAVATSTPAPTVSTVSIALYNGTQTPNLSDTIEKQIMDKTSNVKVTLKTQAANDKYEKTIVYDVTGKKKDSAETLAKIVGGEVGPLPDSEKKINSVDFIVLLGKQK